LQNAERKQLSAGAILQKSHCSRGQLLYLRALQKRAFL